MPWIRAKPMSQKEKKKQTNKQCKENSIFRWNLAITPNTVFQEKMKQASLAEGQGYDPCSVSLSNSMCWGTSVWLPTLKRLSIKQNGIGGEIQPYFAETIFCLIICHFRYKTVFLVVCCCPRAVSWYTWFRDFSVKSCRYTRYCFPRKKWNKIDSEGLGQFSQLNDINIYYQVHRFFAYVMITKFQVPQYSAHVFIKKSSGTKLIYENNYAMRVLNSRNNGRDIKEREDRQNQKKVHVIGKGYKNCELIYPFSVCNSFFFQWQRQPRSNCM